MIQTAPDVYAKYATKDSKGQTILYIHLLNTLYGIMKAALLFYQHFIGNITTIGFKINPYDPCIMNKFVKGNQLMIMWHIDNLKVSHHNAYIVTHMACWLKKTYQQIFSDGSGTMKISHKKIHKYLGMNLNFSVTGEVKVAMILYVKEIITKLAKFDKSDAIANTPAANNLFQVNDTTEWLDDTKSATFHCMIAKALFLMK